MSKFGRAIWFGEQRFLRIHWNIEAVFVEVVDPKIVRFRDEQFAIETGKYSLEGIEPPVLSPGGVTRVDRLIGVAKQRWFVSCAARKKSHVVESAIEWCAVGNHAMIHLIHARVQTCSAGRTGRTLAVVLCQSNSVFSQPIEVGCFHKWMASNRQAIGTKLIQGDEQDIE